MQALNDFPAIPLKYHNNRFGHKVKKKRPLRKVLSRFKQLMTFLVLIFVLAENGCKSPQPTGEDFTEIDISENPQQEVYTPEQPIKRETRHCEFTIKPVATYKVSAMVVCKKYYSGQWQAEISPVDLVLVWGKLAEPDYDKYIKYWQTYRWYFFEYKSGSPFDNSFVYAHSANNHIIPATENISLALRTIKKKEEVMMEGYLVKLTGKYKGGDVWWNSSLSRTDCGDGACELFYVKKVKIGSNIYE